MKDIEEIVAELLPHLDKQPEREGLRETPERVRRFFDEFLAPPPINFKVFHNEGYDEMVLQTDIAFYSICEHHLLPFFGQATVAYIPGKSIVGLSKLSRIVEHFSRRLQNQERLTTQVADFLEKAIEPKGVGIVLSARHLCMEMRGVKKTDVLTTTSCLRGSFKADLRTRAEFMQLAKTK